MQLPGNRGQARTLSPELANWLENPFETFTSNYVSNFLLPIIIWKWWGNVKGIKCEYVLRKITFLLCGPNFRSRKWLSNVSLLIKIHTGLIQMFSLYIYINYGPLFNLAYITTYTTVQLFCIICQLLGHYEAVVFYK